MAMTSGQKCLKSAIVVAVMLSSTSAVAQWQGTWDTDFGDIRLHQTDKYVYGDYRDIGTIQGVLSADKRTMRGIFRRKDNGRVGHFEWKLTNAASFAGNWNWQADALPSWNGRGSKWTGRRLSATRPRLATYKSTTNIGTFFGSQDQKYVQWATAMYQSGSRSSSTTQASTATVDTGVQGTWNITISGTEYGPFKDRRQAFSFSAPDRDGVVTGTSLGRNNVIFLGRTQNGSNRKLHGIWMEAKRGRATGRWGLMRVGTSGEPARNAQIFLSVGYREPQKAFTGKYPGQIGMEARGPKVHSDRVSIPSRGQAQAQWRSLLTKDSPFPAIHGIWPTGEIDAAIQPWIRGDKVDASFGGSELVDPCAAKCMGKEPTMIRALLIKFDGSKYLEANSEWAGVGSFAISIMDEAGAAKRRYSARRFFDIPRENAISDRRSRGVQPPTFVRRYACSSVRRPAHGNGARIAIEPGSWSDPLSDVKLHTQYAAIEVGAVKARDKTYRGASNVESMKSAIAGAHKASRNTDGADLESPCMIDVDFVRKGKNSVNSADVIVRFEALDPA